MKNFVLGPHAAQQVRELINSNAATLAKRRTRAALGLPVDPPHPFRVQWAASADDGDGAWLIYLPATNLVVIANHTADPADDLDEVGGDYPEGWYVLPDSVLDRDDGGVLYCNLDTTAFTATLSMTPGTFAVPVCEATVDSATGARQVQQFVTSAIVTAPPTAANDYDCDEVSLSQRTAGSVPSGFFSIKGFGRFSPRAGETLGSYQAATDAELEVGGDDSGFAVLCRTGNQDVVGANALAYRKLKIGTSGSSPFAFAKTVTTSGGESVVTYKLVNCVFYWGGVLQQLADYTIDSGTLAAGTVYLSGTLAAAGSSWSWALGTAPASAPAGGRVLNYKLYDFAEGKISLDYRTTFLALGGPIAATETVDVITGLKLQVSNGKLEILVQKTPLTVVAKGTPGSYAATQDTQLTLSTKEVVIKTDFEIAANLTTDNHYLGLKYKTAQLSVLGVGADSAATITKQNMRTIPVVEQSEYDTTTHKFVNTYTQIDVPDFGESEGTDEIFEATPHSGESEPSQGAGE